MMWVKKTDKHVDGKFRDKILSPPRIYFSFQLTLFCSELFSPSLYISSSGQIKMAPLDRMWILVLFVSGMSSWRHTGWSRD